MYTRNLTFMTLLDTSYAYRKTSIPAGSWKSRGTPVLCIVAGILLVLNPDANCHILVYRKTSVRLFASTLERDDTKLRLKIS
jgi:hypothetical protein